jgi:hypothetical protein
MPSKLILAKAATVLPPYILTLPEISLEKRKALCALVNLLG